MFNHKNSIWSDNKRRMSLLIERNIFRTVISLSFGLKKWQADLSWSCGKVLREEIRFNWERMQHEHGFYALSDAISNATVEIRMGDVLWREQERAPPPRWAVCGSIAWWRAMMWMGRERESKREREREREQGIRCSVDDTIDSLSNESICFCIVAEASEAFDEPIPLSGLCINCKREWSGSK